MQAIRMAINNNIANSSGGKNLAANPMSNIPNNTNPSISVPSPSEKLDYLKGVLGEKELYRLGVIECDTCESRRYQDGSDDPGVSFKSPGKISPGSSASVVKSHEMEHVFREQAKAERDDRRVISQSVQLSVATCPECGRSYVSGGKTTTTTVGKSKPPVDDDILKGLYLDERI